MVWGSSERNGSKAGDGCTFHLHPLPLCASELHWHASLCSESKLMLCLLSLTPHLLQTVRCRVSSCRQDWRFSNSRESCSACSVFNVSSSQACRTPRPHLSCGTPKSKSVRALASPLKSCSAGLLSGLRCESHIFQMHIPEQRVRRS